MAFQNRGTNLPGIVAAADFSLTQHRFITIDTNGEAALSTLGERIDAVLEDNPIAGQAAALMGPGSVAKITSGEAIAIGDELASDATGRCKTASASEQVGGVALSSAGGAGELVSVWVVGHGGTATIGAGAVVRSMLEADIIDESKIEDGAVGPEHLAGSNTIFGDDLGQPDLADDNRFLTSTVMLATPYTLDNTTLPADNPPRNIIVTHTADGNEDTLGSIIITGTNVDDDVINETLVINGSGTVIGTKAFKTVTAAVSASWVADGNSDLIEIGFDNLLGLSRVMSAAANLFLAALAGVTRLPDSVAFDAADVEENTISLTGGTYDGTKTAKALVRL